MMGKGAARMGDMAMTCNDPADMPTGTVIAAGTVLINKMPAAKKNDQVVGVDIHIVMVPSPAGPVPTPLPHPFTGILDSGLSTTVKIMGQPAAMQDSQASNTPSHIATPPGTTFQKPPSNKAKIMMGSFNVMIGNGGGGGGGSGSSGSGQSASAESSGVESAKGHFLNVKFVDKGGKPVTGGQYEVKDPDDQVTRGPLAGQVQQAGVSEGNHEISLKAITKADWSTKTAEVGEKVKIQVETAGFEDEQEALLNIFVRDIGFADRLYRTLEAQVKGNKIEVEWELQIDQELLDMQRSKQKYSSPTFYFSAIVDQCTANSNILRYKDWVEINLKDKDGNVLKDQKIKVQLSNGEIRETNTDNQGKAKLENVPPGQVKVIIIP